MTLKFVRNQWIGSPEDFRVLLRPRAGNEIGGVEAGIARREELLGFRHELWTPFGARLAYLGPRIHPLAALACITGVMSVADVSARTFLRADMTQSLRSAT
jgi:hypothetical protein